MATNTNKINSFEVLSRLKLDGYGFISPLEFIHIAEERGLIFSLGQYVLRQVQRFYNRLLELELKPVIVSLNVSVIELSQKEFVSEFIQAVKALGIPRGFLQLEVTETVLAENYLLLSRHLNQLREEGFPVSIDDFGTGYSSLSYLRKDIIDHLKIDKTFIDNLGKDSRSNALVEVIVDLAHKLNVRVVAEGVEEEKQVKMLEAMGCDYIQGYVYSKPLVME